MQWWEHIHPKFEKMRLKTKGSSGFEKVPIFALNNAILLGCVNTRSLEKNSKLKKS